MLGPSFLIYRLIPLLPITLLLQLPHGVSKSCDTPWDWPPSTVGTNAVDGIVIGEFASFFQAALKELPFNAKPNLALEVV